MAWIPVAVAALNAAGVASKGGGAVPNALQSSTNQIFDNSGWDVNFGPGNLSSSRSQSTPSIGGGQLQGAQSTSALGGSAAQYVPFALMILGVVVVWKLSRKKK